MVAKFRDAWEFSVFFVSSLCALCVDRCFKHKVHDAKTQRAQRQNRMFRETNTNLKRYFLTSDVEFTHQDTIKFFVRCDRRLSLLALDRHNKTLVRQRFSPAFC